VRRGRLRIYLGAAPGVGKTFAMLNEGRRRAGRGTDVVVGFVEPHGRAQTAAQVGELEVVPRRTFTYRGTTLEEMDLDALLARHPDVALVDELAHTNAPGAKHEKRWEDVYDLLDAGIDVVSTVNIQHLESVNDVVERITGVRQRETLPDWVVREADQVELVDMTPEALRRRMAHGNIYAPDKVDVALANYFRIGNLSALRELALLWVADKVDDALQQYMEDHHITRTWETRERVVVALTGAPSGEQLIRRAARVVQRTHGDLIGVHVRSDEGLATGPGQLLTDHQQLLADLGGEYHEVVSGNIASGLVAFARSVKATQLVLGSTRRTRWAELLHGSVINKAIRLSGDIDVHVISHEPAADSRQPLPTVAGRIRSPLPRRRQLAGWITAATALPLLTTALHAARDTAGLPTVLLLYLLLVCVVAAIGGLRPALASALAASLAANLFFTEPYQTLVIDNAEQVIAVLVFVAASILVSVLVGQTARHTADARRARAEAEALATVAGRLSTDRDPLEAMLSHLRITFAQDAAAILAPTPSGGWSTEAAAGEPEPTSPRDGEAIDLDAGLVLCLVPGRLSADDRRILDAFAAKLAEALERRSLAEAAAAATARTQADELRTAILRAVSHDFRSPLASIKASATSLLQDDIDWSAAARREFAHTIDEEADRLDRLVGNLLDMSRIETGTLDVTTRPVGLEEVIASALDSLSQPTHRVIVDIADDLPTAVADPGLFERVVANLVSNALDHSSPDTTVRVEAASVADHAILRVVDRGPGVPPDDRDRILGAFQRLDDHGTRGVGLGLAVTRGFVTAMHGQLSIEDTPGGGLTVTLALPFAGHHERTAPASPRVPS
jgi:two-component system, OmpR family, sensor histidine kinase KdpD